MGIEMLNIGVSILSITVVVLALQCITIIKIFLKMRKRLNYIEMQIFELNQIAHKRKVSNERLL